MVADIAGLNKGGRCPSRRRRPAQELSVNGGNRFDQQSDFA